MASILLQNKLIEAEPSPTSKRKPFFSYLLGLRSVIRENREFSRFLVASAFLVMATMPTGFFTVRVLKDFHADEAMVGLFTLTMIIFQGVGSLGIGFLIDRYGNKLALVYASVAMGCASLVALVAPSSGWFVIVFMFLGINLGADVMARYNLAIEYGTPERRSTYVGLMNTLIAPFYLAGVLGGVISDLFGYPVLFLTGLVLSLIGIYLLVRRVRDPRTLPRALEAQIPA
jgi:MFS family permease